MVLFEVKDTIYPNQGIKTKRKNVRGVVLNNKNEVAILKIDCEDIFGKRDHYELPGGGVEAGEDFLSAFKREILEEVGVTIQNIMIIGTVLYEYNLLQRQEEGHFYLAYVDQYQKRSLTKEEENWIQDLRWIPIQKLITILDSYPVENVGKLIHHRDGQILKRAYQIMQTK